MRDKIFIFLVCTMMFASCKDHQQHAVTVASDAPITYSLLNVLENNSTPTVDIASYNLVNDPNNSRRTDAEEIMQLKRKWPLALQSLDPVAFDSILSKNYTHKGIKDFYNRADYIKSRTTPDEWKITSVKYENITVQFVDNTGILSYLNHIRNEHTVTGVVETEHISWVDVYSKENGKWKLRSAHAIDYRLDK